MLAAIAVTFLVSDVGVFRFAATSKQANDQHIYTIIEICLKQCLGDVLEVCWRLHVLQPLALYSANRLAMNSF